MIFFIVSSLFLVVLQELVQIRQFLRSHLGEECCELVLPLVAMTKQSKLERGAVEHDKLNVEDCFLLLDIVGNFSVSVSNKTIKIYVNL